MAIDDELLDLILHGREERNLEYKQSAAWQAEMKAKLCKSIMAMANLRDGGAIVIGVERQADDSYNPVGMDANDAKTFTHDIVVEYANEFAAPFVEITLDNRVLEHRDWSQQRMFVVIKVSEFTDMPVVCRKNGAAGLRRGAFFTRGRRKHETVEVSNEPELREILDLALEKRIRRMQAFGPGPPSGAQHPGDAELFAKQMDLT
jgi:hypothetical protein